jgi:uncharacterized protein (TIGR03382 family)
MRKTALLVAVLFGSPISPLVVPDAGTGGGSCAGGGDEMMKPYGCAASPWTFAGGLALLALVGFWRRRAL